MVTFSKLGHRLAAANKPLPRDAKGELVEPTSKLQQLKHHITTPWFWGTCVSSLDCVISRRSVLMSGRSRPTLADTSSVCLVLQVVHLHRHLHRHDQCATVAAMVLAPALRGADHPLRPLAEHPDALL